MRAVDNLEWELMMIDNRLFEVQRQVCRAALRYSAT